MDRQINWIPSKNQGSAVDFVIEAFREALINKKLVPGDKLPSETELAVSMQVSRSTIREAMKVLSAYGLIEISRGNGTFISRSDDNITMDPILFGFLLSQPSEREQLEFRTYMERIVMELLIQNATAENIKALEENYAELLSIADDPECSMQNDIRFHELLGEFTGNRLVARVYKFSIMYFRASIESTHKNFGGVGAIKIHRMVIDAVRNRDLAMVDDVISENTKTWVTSSDKLYFG